MIFGALLAVWTLGIHFIFIRSVPDPIFQPDSPSYLSLAMAAFDHRGHGILLDRSPAYPFFLYAVIRLTASFLGVLVVQHGLVILTGLAAAWSYYRFFRPSLWGSALVFFTSAAFPVTAVYAHSILTETLYTFLLMTAVLLILTAEEKQRKSLWYGVGVIVSLAVLTRPTGIALVGALGILGVFSWAREQSGTGGWHAVAVVLIVLLSISTWNYFHLGFFGIDQMAGPAIFCSNAHYLDVNDIKNPAVREVLKPIYARYEDRISDGGWVYSAEEGPVQKLSALYPPAQLYKILFHLGFQAIKAHPFLFARDRLKLLNDFLWRYSAVAPIYMNREFTFFLYRGLRIYGSMVGSQPGAWQLLRHGPKDVQNYLERIRPLTVGSIEHPEEYINEIDRQDVYRYEKVLAWWYPLQGIIVAMRWLPAFALLSALLLYRQKRLQRLLCFILGVIGVHALVSTMAAFQDPRFAAPLTPLYAILAIAGLQLATDRLVGGIRKERAAEHRDEPD